MKYTNFVNPLDWESILVDHLAGSIEIFMFVALIFIAYMSAKWRMPTGAFFMMITLFAGLMYSYYPSLLAIVGLIVGLVGAFIIGRAFNQ